MLILIKKFSKDKLLDSCDFFSSLKDECINEKGYLHAISVWNTFEMNTVGKYDLSLKTDVLLLADVFERFIVFRILWIRSFSLF